MAKQKSENPLLKKLLKSANNKYASIVEDGIIGDNFDYIDTGSYILNAQFSGSLYGGFPANQVTALAGESGVGKTYFVMQAIISFQKKYPDGLVLYYESEKAISRQMLKNRGIDLLRVVNLPVNTIQEFRHQVLKALNVYEEDENTNKPKLMIVLDSLGNLSTLKEVEDIRDGKNIRDMTRAQLVRGAFRAITLQMGLLGVPMILTNHTYETMGLFTQKKMGGGGGVVYAASTISFLSKAQDKDGKDIVGGILTSTLQKGRLTKEKTKVKTRLSFRSGLDRHYGLLEFGEKCGVFTKLSNKYMMPDGTKAYEKHIYKNPEKFFTKDVMKKLEDAAQEAFLYNNEDVIKDDEKEVNGNVV